MVLHDFDQFNREMNDLYAYLNDNKYTEDEIRRIFAPIRPKWSNFPFWLLLLTLLFAFVIVLYILSNVEWFSWHLSALSRIILIEFLPLYDWTSLKNEKCLIKYPVIMINDQLSGGATTGSNESFNCQLCEDLIDIDKIDTAGDSYHLKKRYLDLHSPIVLIDNSSDNFTLLTVSNVINLFLNDAIYSESMPCSISTNVYDSTGVVNVRTLLQQIDLFKKFFLHYQNCDLRAVKLFRKFVARPSFLPPDLVPIQYSWLLWSKDYNASTYKSVDLIDKIAVFGQIHGSNHVKLIPRVNCVGKCHEIDLDLVASQVLIITQLWDIKYKPYELGENLAVILETH